MRRAMTAAVFTAVCVWVAASAALANNCQSKFLDTAYNCTFACTGTPGTTLECVSFGDFGHSVLFDIFDTFDGDGGCTCTDSGTANQPKFDSSSNSFECTLNDFPGGYVGKINGHHLKGQSFYEDGASCVFNCTLMGTACP